MGIFSSNFGRNVLHLLTYGLAVGAIAILEQVGGMDFGTYTPYVALATGFVMDYIRKRFTTI